MHRAYFLLVALLLALSACQKVVQLNLKNAASQYVIQGNITDQPGPYTVQITQTTGFYQSNSFAGVSGASVKIWDEAGHMESLSDQGNGFYLTQDLQGVQGMTYHLSVIIQQDTVTATSTMPYLVPFDSLYTSTVNNGGTSVIVAVPYFQNPSGTHSYYFFNQTINGYLDKTLYYANSNFTEGQWNTFPLERNSSDSTLHTGDTVSVEMQCTDSVMYNYWSSMDAAASGAGQGFPGNPVTNLVGNALGYFSAHTSRTKGLRVKAE